MTYEPVHRFWDDTQMKVAKSAIRVVLSKFGHCRRYEPVSLKEGKWMSWVDWLCGFVVIVLSVQISWQSGRWVGLVSSEEEFILAVLYGV